MKGLMSAREASYKWGVSERRISFVSRDAFPDWSGLDGRGSFWKMLRSQMLRDSKISK